MSNSFRTASLAVVLSILIGNFAMTTRAQTYHPVPAQMATPRGGLPHFFAKLAAGKPVSIAYFGGSITEANGWRPKTLAWFRQKYPKSTITEINAAIGGTGSDLGAFRCRYDVLSHKPDLIFIEFAVNDGGTPPEAIWRQVDGIVRQAKLAIPDVDICFIYTFVTGFADDLSHGVCPRAASADDMLAEYYNLPSINVALKIAQLHEAGKLIFVPQKDEKGNDLPAPDGVTIFSHDNVHPLDAGHEIYASIIEEALTQMASLPASPDAPLKPPFVRDAWTAAKLVPIEPAMLGGAWTKLTSTDPAFGRFTNRLPEIWQTSQPGATLTFRFKGTQVGLYDIVGPDGGEAIVTLDDRAPVKVLRFDHYCTYHRLQVLQIGSGLPDVVHTVKIELSNTQPDRTPASSQEKGPFDPKKYEGTVLRAGWIMLIGDIVK